MDKPRHPKGLAVLFLTEMWERFSYYLMLGILPLYLGDSEKGGMGWDPEKVATVVGSYIALVYFTPFIGGLIADRVLGLRRTVVLGAILMMIGHLVLAVPTETGLYLGLMFLILGNGAFKPNISTLLGNLYPVGSPLKDSGYNIFYMGINVGAFACNIVAAIVRNKYDREPLVINESWTIGGWHAAFATAAFGMMLGLIIFLLNYSRLAPADPPPKSSASSTENLTPLFLQCLLPSVALGAIGWILAEYELVPFKAPTAAFIGACIPAIVFYIRIWYNVPDAEDRGRVAGLLVIFGVVVVFWMTFHLNVSALNTWTVKSTDREPGAIMEVAARAIPDLTELAPASYYENAGPQVPRPDPLTLDVVTDKEYKELEGKKALSVKDGEPLVVTETIKKKIYEREDENTPHLEKNEHLKIVNSEVFQSINAGMVVLFTPLVVGTWHWMRARGREPSNAAKIGLGLLLTAGGPLVMFGATMSSNDGATKASALWLFGTYAMVTFGELCLSPMGLSLVNKVSPPSIRAFMMGGWFLSTSFGNKLSGIFGEVYTKMDHKVFWIVLVACDVGFAMIIFLLLPWLNRQMTERK